MKLVVEKMLRASGLVMFFLLTTAGIPTNGIPTNGIPTNGIPTNGIPTNGIPTNGIPTNGIPTNGIPTNAMNLDALENSLIFANRQVHTAFIGRPFTADNLKLWPVSQIFDDPFSALLVSYLWQDAHSFGDDFEYTAPNGRTFRFYGNVGLCDRAGNGWARNTDLFTAVPGGPADPSCARWVSALIITQINQSGIHNLFSARGPGGNALLPGFIGPQMTDMSPALHSFDYKFGTRQPVEAMHDVCPAGTTGPENCGWQPGYVGTGTPGTSVRISLASNAVPMLAQVNQGIMGHDYPWAAKGSCAGLTPLACQDADVLASSVDGAVDPSVQFTIPPSGVFNVQWTTFTRGGVAPLAGTPSMTATVVGAGAVSFPADELDVFPWTNREMTASGIIFGEANIDPALWSCEARLFTQVEGRPVVRLCAVGDELCSSQCTRPFKPGAQHVIFPNAHLWLSRHWNSAQDYYKARSCSADLSTCIATFEGYIDALWFNAATSRFVLPCLLQSADLDAHLPLPYAGPPKRLHDANFCFVDSVLQPYFDVTTFFPNYRAIGACGAVGPAAAASCAYTPPGSFEECKD